MAEHVCAEVPHRQFVFTIPKRLRIFFRFDRRLLGQLCRAAARTVITVYRAASGRPDAVPGMVGANKTEHNAVGRFPEPGDEELLAGPSRNFQVFDPLDFLAEVTQHIPAPGEHLIRYCGCCSNQTRGQRAQRQPAPAGTGIPARSPTAREARQGWAALIRQVVWTDAIQALVLMAGAILCFVLAGLRVEGGFAGMAEIAIRDAKLLESLRWERFDVADGTTSAVVLFVAFFFNSLITCTSSQDVVQRYVTTRDLAAARRSLWLTMWLSVFGSLVFFGLGVAIYAFYKTHPGQLDPAMAANDSILPFYIMQQLPVGVSGLVIAAIFAASQSTVSSSLNSVATASVKDVDARLLRPGRDDRTYLRAAQGAVVVAGSFSIAVAIWMAESNLESAFKTFNILIGLTAGSLGGLFALGVFTRRAHGTGALLGALLGLGVVLGLRFSGAPVTGLLYGFIGFAVCFGAGWLLSLVLPGAGDRSLSLGTRDQRLATSDQRRT